jgi:hypothetical protein
MGKTNSATDSDDEAGVNYGNSFAFSNPHQYYPFLRRHDQ